MSNARDRSRKWCRMLDVPYGPRVVCSRPSLGSAPRSSVFAGNLVNTLGCIGRLCRGLKLQGVGPLNGTGCSMWLMDRGLLRGGEACHVCSKRRLGRPEILLHDPVWGRQAGHWLKFSTSNHVASVYTSRAHILPPVQGCRRLSRPANGPGASTALWSKRPQAGNASRTVAVIDPYHSFIPG